MLLNTIVSSLTLLVTLISAFFSYRLQKQTKKIDALKKNYCIVLENLGACYKIEEHLASKLNITHRQLQSELKPWLEKEGIALNRDYYSPSFIEKQLAINN